jgi:hypothetical protein
MGATGLIVKGNGLIVKDKGATGLIATGLIVKGATGLIVKDKGQG